jgi:hypothetical protein
MWRQLLSNLSSALFFVAILTPLHGFVATTKWSGKLSFTPHFQAAISIHSIEEATHLLSEWDKWYINTNNKDIPDATFNDEMRDTTRNESTFFLDKSQVESAVRLLSDQATKERNLDSTQGRCMLGICASSAEQGIATLKTWVTTLQLPRGLLHGMDKDGVPLDLEGGVYIKYNSGGVYTFQDIRKSGMGFDALWKPGDALLEPYDGIYRGVYFQVELADKLFRQYLVPFDLFDAEKESV